MKKVDLTREDVLKVAKVIYSRRISPTQKLKYAVSNHILILAESIEIVSVLFKSAIVSSNPIVRS